MDIENVKKMIKKYTASHASFIQRAEEARRYYENETDILQEPSKKRSGKPKGSRKRRCGMRITESRLTSTGCW